MESGIQASERHARQDRCREFLASQRLDGLLVVSGPFYDRAGDVAYLTGHYPPFPSVNFHGEYRGLGFSAFVVTRGAGNALVVDTPVFRAERVVADDVRVARNLPREIARALADLGLRSARVGLAGSQVAPYALVQEISVGSALTFEAADDILPELRRSKSAAEVELLRRAAQVAEIGMAAALATIAPGRTESEVCAEGVRAGIAEGADFVRYLRVLSGPFAGWPHRWPPATTRAMRDGELVCLDYIGAVNGYQFDILRARAVGVPNAERAAMLEVAAAATEAAIEACGPGVPTAEVVAASDRILAEAGFLGDRAAFTGHGIGLETVEAPLVMAESQDVLRAGDVICLEPGILRRNEAGARFEYEVAITDDGAEVLARPRDHP